MVTTTLSLHSVMMVFQRSTKGESVGAELYIRQITFMANQQRQKASKFSFVAVDYLRRGGCPVISFS